MHDFLSLLQATSSDREVWNSAERAIENLEVILISYFQRENPLDVIIQLVFHQSNG